MITIGVDLHGERKGKLHVSTVDLFVNLYVSMFNLSVKLHVSTVDLFVNLYVSMFNLSV